MSSVIVPDPPPSLILVITNLLLLIPSGVQCQFRVFSTGSGFPGRFPTGSVFPERFPTGSGFQGNLPTSDIFPGNGFPGRPQFSTEFPGFFEFGLEEEYDDFVDESSNTFGSSMSYFVNNSAQMLWNQVRKRARKDVKRKLNA